MIKYRHFTAGTTITLLTINSLIVQKDTFIQLST
jgi:hypothetical protein